MVAWGGAFGEAREQQAHTLERVPPHARTTANHFPQQYCADVSTRWRVIASANFVPKLIQAGP